jgi:hypothetical protein
MATWNCSFKNLPESITVGTKLTMTCDGEPSGFTAASADRLKLELPKNQNYQLKLLKTVSIGDTGGEFLVTSWTAGELKPEATLTDGTINVLLSPLQLTVATVIEPKTNPEGKPYGPVAPVSMGWPPWFWAMLAAIVVMALACLAMAIFTYLQRRKFLLQLEQNKPAMTPFNQFSKELRKLFKNLPSQSSSWTSLDSQMFFKDLDTSLRWYLARELTIPVLTGSPAAIAREVKRADRKLFDDHGKEIRLLFSEIQKALSAKEVVSVIDATQIAELTRSLTEKINRRLQLKKGA